MYGAGRRHDAGLSAAGVFEVSGRLLHHVDERHVHAALQRVVEAVRRHARRADGADAERFKLLRHVDHRRHGGGLRRVQNICGSVRHARAIENDHVEVLLVGFRVRHVDDQLEQIRRRHRAEAAHNTKALHQSYSPLLLKYRLYFSK